MSSFIFGDDVALASGIRAVWHLFRHRGVLIHFSKYRGGYSVPAAGGNGVSYAHLGRGILASAGR